MQYILGDVITMIYESDPSLNIITSLSDSVCDYSPSMSNMATSQTSCASTPAFVNTEFEATVGKSASYLFIIYHIFPRLYMNISLCIHCISPLGKLVMLPPPIVFKSLVASTGERVSTVYSCVSSFVTSHLTCSLNFLISIFSTYCVMMMWIMWLPHFLSFIFSIASYVFR